MGPLQIIAPKNFFGKKIGFKKKGNGSPNLLLMGSHKPFLIKGSGVFLTAFKFL